MSSILIRMMTVPIIGSIDAHTTSENGGTAEDTGIGMIALMSRGEVGDRVSVGRVARTALLKFFVILLLGSFNLRISLSMRNGLLASFSLICFSNSPIFASFG